jgi:Spy/CpxP family protein refolding chaperone
MKNPIIAALMLGSITAIAQPFDPERGDFAEKREKIEAIKVAYITEELDLTVKESQAFWPIYNELSDKEEALRKKQRDNLVEFKDFEDASDKDIEKAIYEMADLHIQIDELRKSYLDDFIKVIGAKKTAKLLKAEKEFGRKLMERMKRGDRPAPGGERPGPGGGRPMR